MRLYPRSSLGMSTIVIHAITSWMCLFQNADFFILTIFSQCSVSGSFSLVASLSHAFKYFDVVFDGPPARPIHSPHTATEPPPFRRSVRDT